MKEETTSRLDQILKSVDSHSDAKKFAEDHAVQPKFFYEYVNDYIAEHEIVVSEMVELSGISTNYIYGILNGRTKSPGRDKIIAICIAAGMTLDELNRGLEISGNNPLYPKNERDIHIAACVNKGERDVTRINIQLDEAGIEPLKV